MKTKEITKFERYFLFILFFELFAGGGGRFFEIGPVSIRQVLFAGAMILFCIRFILNKQTREEILGYFKKPNTAVFWLSIAMVFWIGVSSLLGILHHHPMGTVVTDAFRVIFVIMIIPFIYYIGDGRFSRKDLLKTLFIAALVVSLITITIGIIGKFMNDEQYYYFYQDINKLFPGDLYFRPSRGAFHKSHFLVLFAVIIGIIKLLEKELTKFQGVVLFLGITSIVLSETRGLYLGFLVGILTYLLTKGVIYFTGDRASLNLSKKSNLIRLLVLFLAIGGTMYFYKNSTISRFSKPDDTTSSYHSSIKKNEEVDDVSLNVRVVLLADSVKIVKESPVNMIVGSGYGTKIGKRTTGIEMSFVDIFVEQGVVGVIIWLAFSLLPLYYYFRSFLLSKKLDNTSIGLLGGSLAMILVTNINPFLNSPIGLGYLLPVIVLSYKLFQDSRDNKKGKMQAE